MQHVTLLQMAADNGLTLVRWLKVDVAAAVPSCFALADQVAAGYPLRVLQGFTNDFYFAIIPLVEPPAWFNDCIIRAFTERLSKNCRKPGRPSLRHP